MNDGLSNTLFKSTLILTDIPLTILKQYKVIKMFRAISQLSIVLILIILLAKASKIQKDLRLSEFENAKRSSGKASRCICGFVSFKCCKKRSSVVEVSW